MSRHQNNGTLPSWQKQIVVPMKLLAPYECVTATEELSSALYFLPQLFHTLTAV
jgi:hypothetical protein